MKSKKYFNIYIVLYFLLNIINTYFLTSYHLNKYIAPLGTNSISIINAIIGNFSILLLFLIIGFILFKRNRNKLRYLTSITLILNIFILLLGYFTLFYTNLFHYKAFDIFKNPAYGVSDGLFTIAIKELFVNYRILVFVPFITLFLIMNAHNKRDLIYKSKTNYIKSKNIIINEHKYKYYLGNRFKLKPLLISFLSFVLLLTSSLVVFNYETNKSEVLKLNINNSTNGATNLGVYPYYLFEFIGIRKDHVSREEINLLNDNDLINEYNYFNKNKDEYKNILDGNTYSNQIKMSDTNLVFHDDLNLNEEDYLTGIFSNKKLKLIHLESLNYFLLDIPEVKNRFVFLSKLLEESVVFNNYYTSVGMGVSSDAEFSVLTGLYPSGDGTIFRDFEKYDLKLDTLPKLFENKDYKSKVYHGDFKEFYNRDHAYDNLFGFTDGYYSLENFAEHFGYNSAFEYMQSNKEGRYYNDLFINSPWPSEFEVHDIIEEQKALLGDKSFIYSHFLTQHTPFLFNPYSNKNQSYDILNYNKISSITKRYLEYVEYIDDLIKSIFYNPTNNESRIDDNTVYVFYSDHGSSLKGDDLSILYNKKLNALDERQLLQHTMAFIYAPSSNSNNLEVPEGLIKGNQNLIRGHQDLYRTIGDLFDLFDNTNYYFGAHGLSNEPSFVIDNRVLDLVFDSKTNNENYFISLRNKRLENIGSNYMIYNDFISDVVRFKKLSDLYIKDKSVYDVLNR